MLINSIQFNMIYSNNIQQKYNLRLYKHAIQVMLFEGNTREVKNL